MEPPTAHPLRFDESYAERVMLADGSEAWLRLVRPSDAEILATGFARLSPQSRYRRFLSERAELRPQDLSYLTRIDQLDHFALGALRELPGGPGDGLGIARFVRIPERPNVAEAAVAVLDEVQRKGLGRILLQRLAAAARERGIDRFACEVLETNLPIHNMLHDLGLKELPAARDGVVSVELPIADLDPHPSRWPSLLEKFFAAVAAGLLVVRRAVDRLAEHG